MATLDETNIFETPVTTQEPRRFSPEYFRQRKEQKAKQKEQYKALGQSVKDNLAQGNIEQAYESFAQLPVVDQAFLYMTPGVGNLIDAYEYDYFKKRSGRELKDPETYQLELLMGGDPREVRPFTQKDPVSGAFSTLAGLSSLFGAGEIPSAIKAVTLPLARRFGMVAKTGTEGGGGGIGELVPQPKQDFAGYISNVEKQALESMNMQDLKTGQDLINYLQSKRRSGISPKELEFIDLEQLRASNPTKEEVVKYIQDNRPNIYRVQRSEDNPTYRADVSDNPLMELPMDEDATRRATREERDYFRDEYASDLRKHNEIITDNLTLRDSNYVLNSENINNPSVLEDVEKYLKYDPEAFSSVNPEVIEIKYPDSRTIALFKNDDFVTGNNPEASGFTMKDLREVVKDGATIEFPALAQADDIIEEASAFRVNPDYGGGVEVYQSVGQNTGFNYQIVGNSETGYRVMIDDTPATGDLGTSTTQQEAFYNDLADARARVQAEAFDNADILEGANNFDTGSNADQLSETAPYDVITGEATLPTKYSDDVYDAYRLPMGGAENYREFTLHIGNPNTPTRYDSSKGMKHFGGGDELLHFRTTDRIDEDGKKVLFVEEMQSDLHATASSKRSKKNYELPKGTIEKTYADIEAIKPKDGKGLLAYNESIDTQFEFTTPNGEVETLTPQEIVVIGKAMSKGEDSMVTPMGGLHSYYDISDDKINSFVDMYGKDDVLKIADMLEPIVMSGNLPNYPYKGNDWIELAVKDIMKLAAEGDYDRVAFTNPATQLRRNQKSLEYIDEIEISQVPKLTRAEIEFDLNWGQNRDRTFLSVPPRGPMSSDDLDTFLDINTDFVVNDPQAQKYWQEFYEDNTSSSMFAEYDSAPTPQQLGEDLIQSLILYEKKKRLNAYEEVIKGVIDSSNNALMTKNEAYAKLLETQNMNPRGSLKFPNKPFDEITLDDIPVSNEEIKNINASVRENILSIMRNFKNHALPNYEDAGKYIVKEKGTGYKIDDSKFMLEKGKIKEDYKKDKANTLDQLLDGLILDKNTKKQIKSDAEKGLIPQSLDDAQIYKIEKEGGSGKKPFDMYAKIIPQQVRKFAEKYDKGAKPQLKKVLYNENFNDVDSDTLYEVYKGRLGGDDQDMLSEGLRTHEALSIDITPQMKEKLLQGINVMYKGGIVNKYKSMDKPIMGNTREM